VKRPLVIGHRGASGYRPEHTRAAYELALALGADAVEPDIVATKDGVLVLRHENEISGTTDVASRPEFASRRTTKVIDGDALTGWFTEDFTWAELATLRAIERLPAVRPNSVSFDGMQPVLRLRDLMDIIDAASIAQGRQLIMVAEIKHATYFASIGLPLDELFAAEVADWATPENLITESFEQTVLMQIRERGVPGRIVFLAESSGSPADLVARLGRRAIPYSAHLTNAGLARLAGDGVDGVSVDKTLLLRVDATGHLLGATDLVDRAHAAGLQVFTWTLRAENRYLAPKLRRGRSPRDYGDWSTEFDLVLGTGLDGVFADQPDLVLAALALRGHAGR
jgi:glycerophosphoryl diester phosphodiesterase